MYAKSPICLGILSIIFGRNVYHGQRDVLHECTTDLAFFFFFEVFPHRGFWVKFFAAHNDIYCILITYGRDVDLYAVKFLY